MPGPRAVGSHPRVMAGLRKLIPFISLPLFLFLVSCAAPGREEVLRAIKDNPGSGAYISDVPFFPQKEYMCGPASLASVISYWAGGDARLKEIAKSVYVEKLKGTLPMDMLIYARERGFDATFYSGGMDDLKRRLSANMPLILFLNLGLQSYPVGHYVVAVGYSDAARAVIVHSGVDAEATIGYVQLEREWSATGYSTLLIRPKPPAHQ